MAKSKQDKDSEAPVADLDALFQLPLAEFTAARNALAASLKKAGDAEAAERVKEIAKPNISAWTVNQLFWQQRTAFDRLLEAGAAFRTAQTSQLAGQATDLRGTLEARREALAAASRLAADILRNAGHSATPDLMRRITTTLEALSTYGGLPDTPSAGRLTSDVDPPGFETLAALVPRIGQARGDGPSRVLPFQHQKAQRKPARKLTGKEAAKAAEEDRKVQLAAAKAAVQEQERALRAARKAAEQAEAALKKAAARAKETEREAGEAERQKAAADARYEKAAAEAEAARKDARATAQQAEEAAQAVEDSERALDRARRALNEIDG